MYGKLRLITSYLAFFSSISCKNEYVNVTNVFYVFFFEDAGGEECTRSTVISTKSQKSSSSSAKRLFNYDSEEFEIECITGASFLNTNSVRTCVDMFLDVKWTLDGTSTRQHICTLSHLDVTEQFLKKHFPNLIAEFLSTIKIKCFRYLPKHNEFEVIFGNNGMQTMTVNATNFVVRDDAVINTVIYRGSTETNANNWFTQDGAVWSHAGCEISNNNVVVNNWFKEDTKQYNNSFCVYASLYNATKCVNKKYFDIIKASSEIQGGKMKFTSAIDLLNSVPDSPIYWDNVRRHNWKDIFTFANLWEYISQHDDGMLCVAYRTQMYSLHCITIDISKRLLLDSDVFNPLPFLLECEETFSRILESNFKVCSYTGSEVAFAYVQKNKNVTCRNQHSRNKRNKKLKLVHV